MLQELLGLRARPIAIAFRESAPPGVPRVAAPGPASCAYWKRAADGETFYTEAADHWSCPIGAHTHGAPVPPERAGELMKLVKELVGLEYIRMEEVPAIPRRDAPFGVALYGPWPGAPFEPDVVLVRGTARQAMLLVEAAGGESGAPVPRPTCAILPAVMRSARAGVSFGCIGNRVYTGLGDDEMYVAIPGARAAAVAAALEKTVAANRALEGAHREKLLALR